MSVTTLPETWSDSEYADEYSICTGTALFRPPICSMALSEFAATGPACPSARQADRPHDSAPHGSLEAELSNNWIVLAN